MSSQLCPGRTAQSVQSNLQRMARASDMRAARSPCPPSRRSTSTYNQSLTPTQCGRTGSSTQLHYQRMAKAQNMRNPCAPSGASSRCPYRKPRPSPARQPCPNSTFTAPSRANATYNACPNSTFTAPNQANATYNANQCSDDEIVLENEIRPEDSFLQDDTPPGGYEEMFGDIPQLSCDACANMPQNLNATYGYAECPQVFQGADQPDYSYIEIRPGDRDEIVGDLSLDRNYKNSTFSPWGAEVRLDVSNACDSFDDFDGMWAKSTRIGDDVYDDMSDDSCEEEEEEDECEDMFDPFGFF